jgi:pyruvate dehydrogenase E2 component (dihydrolipoamide acetyltransferase)
MANPVIMPKTGMAMEEGTVLRWRKQEGEAVAKGEVLLEIETDKTSMEVEAEADGVLLRILAREGQVVPVTQTIAWIGRPGEELGAAVGEPSPPSPGKAPATPAARRQAALQGLSLSELSGSGPLGAVRLRDLPGPGAGPVEPPAAASQPPAAGQPLQGRRKAIADKMVRSWQVPSPTLLARVDVTELERIRHGFNAAGDLHIGVTDMVIKAAAAALREHPLLNCTLEGGRIVPHQEVNIGLAVALEDGLAVPVLHGADRLSLRRISEAARELAARARERRLGGEQSGGGTFTVSNLGMYGITAFTPLLNVPECAILGVGAIQEVPRFDEHKQVVARQELELSLTHDHRVIDGAPAALFLRSVRRLLENPLALLS